MTKSNYVIITMKNGSMIYGLYSGNSLASSLHNEKDLYIERVYNVDSDDNWNQVDGSTGMWLNAFEILHIELFNALEETGEEENDGEE
ncbi:hypothetical protein HGO21_29400 [Acinetobacter sp. CUI P1]|nr:hypothetical protein [Acinetobacter sp. CUI P1]